MPGFDLLSTRHDAAPALWDDSTETAVTHADAHAVAEQYAALIETAPGKPLVFVIARSVWRAPLAWIGAWRANAAVALINPDLPSDRLDGLISAYQPDFIIDPAEDPCTVSRRDAPHGAIHDDLALLLLTSGSTGAPKAVRLTAEAVQSNTEAIIESLSLGPDDCGIGHLAFHYSYGMSVANSHLASGGSVIITNASAAQSALWKRASALGASLFPGVPPQYQVLHRLKFDPEKLCPSLTKMTQAGGKLAPELVENFCETMRARGGGFFVMYGQTEAGPRISCHEASATDAPVASAGFALKGGHLEIRDEAGSILALGETGYVHYCGPNVMMGYAETHADLAAGDTHGNWLDTGDIGHLDAEGRLYITGRSSRFAKIAGVRCSLDEIERVGLSVASPCAAIAGDGVVTLVWLEGAVDNLRTVRADAAKKLSVPATALNLKFVDAFPVLSSGKLDYEALKTKLSADA